METLYVIAGTLALATVVTVKWGSRPMPAVILALLTAIFLAVTPVGQDVIGLLINKGGRVAEVAQ
ncbi:hypothetical protein [Amycolatopsis thailandensis]|uniref:hypothetical protein n=1 Tax=Amycolatopsis thailandensis TaxID=589330 RepID=UPI003643AE47